jgi:hypothetical protein
MAISIRRIFVISLSLFALAPASDAQAKVLVMRARCEDQTAFPPPFTVAAVANAFDLLQAYAPATSYQGFTIDDWDMVNVRLPCNWGYYTNASENSPKNSLAMREALAYARFQLGVNLSNYTHHVLLSNLKNAPNKFEAGAGGNGVPGGKVWLSALGYNLVAHEFFHSLNIAHSTGRTDLIGEPSPGPFAWQLNRAVMEAAFFQAYGNPFTVMASGGLFEEDAHLDVRTKHHLGWLPEARVTNVTDPLVTEYDVYQQDTLHLPGTVRPKALRIHRDARSDYWIEFRQRASGKPVGCETNADQGVLVYLADKDWRYMGPGVGYSTKFEPAQLLDMHWESSCGAEWLDAALEVGEEFREPAIGVMIKLLALEPALGDDPPRARVKIVFPTTRPSSANDDSAITFTSPTNNVTEYFNPSTRTFRAEIADAEGIDSVLFELYAGGETPYATQVGIDDGPGTLGQRYKAAFDLSGLSEGGYVITTTVTDVSGRKVNDGTYFTVARPVANCGGF